jgi:arsenical pump membrane protein
VLTTRLDDAAQQAWPAFVLVSGLLLVGITAHADGLFEQAGRALERLPGPPLALLGACIALVTVVTAVLNLDTAVVFLTPILVHSARARGSAEEPFLYSAVFMANASSLYLPGSNLTNLLVLAHTPLSGSAFAARLIVPALAATLATAVGLMLRYRRRLRERRAERPPSRDRASAPVLGAAAALIAAGLTVALRNAALYVLAVGLLGAMIQVARGRTSVGQVVRAVGPLVLLALFVAALALGVLARSWNGPAELLSSTGRWGTAGLGALTAVLVNNLPAAVLLSAHHVAHPAALLVGLNLGPNLAMTGSLSAVLWFRVARQVEAKPSIARYSGLGIFLAPLGIVAALGAMTLLGAPA